MRILQVDSDKYKNSLSNIAHLIRVGYILSTHLVSAGSSTNFMTIHLLFKDMPLYKQVLILKAILASEEDAKILETYLRIDRQFKAVKRPDKELIVAFKKIEASTRKLVEGWVKTNIAFQKAQGLYLLYELDEDEVCNFLFLMNDADDIDDELSEKYVYTFDILENRSVFENANNNIWILPSDFLTKEIVEFATTELKPKLLYTKKYKLTPYLVEACTIPNFINYSNQELSITQKMFSEKYHTFQYHCNEWCKKCYAGGGVDYFTHHVYPLLDGIKTVFDEDTLVNFKKNTDVDKKSFTLLLGEVSPLHIWNYYRNQLTDFDDKFEEMYENYKQMNANYTVPVFIMMEANKNFNEINNNSFEKDILDFISPKDENEITDESLLTSKKHFDIDD